MISFAIYLHISTWCVFNASSWSFILRDDVVAVLYRWEFNPVTFLAAGLNWRPHPHPLPGFGGGSGFLFCSPLLPPPLNHFNSQFSGLNSFCFKYLKSFPFFGFEANEFKLHHNFCLNQYLLFTFENFCLFFLRALLNLLQYCFCFMFWFFSNEAGRLSQLHGPLLWKAPWLSQLHGPLLWKAKSQPLDC